MLKIFESQLYETTYMFTTESGVKHISEIPWE